VSNTGTATREKIMRQGLALMSQSGLSGVTLGVLADQVGMSKSGLFAHFRSKEDVQVELLTHMADFVQSRVVTPSMGAAEGLPRLRALIANWFGWAKRAGLPGGCPVAAGLFEFDDIEGRVRDKILEMEADWRRFLTDLVQRAVDLGHLRRGLEVHQFVWELCGVYLAHHAAQRFLRAADADARAQTAIEALISRASHSRGRRAATHRSGPKHPRQKARRSR
jgi:AcrR family transcriptional regulator